MTMASSYSVIVRVRVALKRTLSTTWAGVIFRVKWIVFVRRSCYDKFGSLKLIGQFSHDDRLMTNPYTSLLANTILAKLANQSPWSEKEIKKAISRKKNVVPFDKELDV